MNYSIIKSDFHSSIEDITWSCLTADLFHYNNFKEEHVLDYDKGTYTTVEVDTNRTQLALQFKVKLTDKVYTDKLYLNWKDILNTRWIYVYTSDDLSTWTALNVIDCYGDADNPGIIIIQPSTQYDGKCIVTLDSSKATYYRIIFQSTTTYTAGDLMEIYSCWMGNDLDVIEPDIDKTEDIYIYNVNKIKTFDGTYYNNIMGGHKKSKWNIKWSYLTKTEKDIFIDFIDSLIYTPKMLLIDYDNINNWCEGLCLLESINIEETDDYLYSTSLEIQEL